MCERCMYRVGEGPFTGPEEFWKEEDMKDRTISLRVGWWTMIAFFAAICGLAFTGMLN